MKVLILDFETTSGDAENTNATEVGARMFQAVNSGLVPHPFYEGLSALCYDPGDAPLEPFITEITGITDEMLISEGRPRRIVFQELLPLVEAADLIMAHKIAFDRTVFERTCGRLDLPVPPNKEWLCTLTNFNWPKKFTCHKLGHLAWEHDIDVKASSLHRAINDVDLLARLVNQYNFENVLAYARTPWRYLKADVLGPWKDGGKQNSIAKSLGFSWETVKGTDKPKWDKTWVTRVKTDKVEELRTKVMASESPFRVTEIQGIS